jgi:vancomycin permeability regulator SanA
LSIIAIITSLVIFSYTFIDNYSQYVMNDAAMLKNVLGDEETVGIVLGGGIENGKPRPLLKERLDAAGSLLYDGVITKLIVSGDNRVASYNEPQVMKDYLVKEKHMDASKIQLDNAGRSTYESCERARKVFGLTRVVLISESAHLARAVYLCRSFSREAYGYASTGWAADYLRKSQGVREVMARTKAILNVYVIGEKTVLGPPIKVL